MSIYGYKDKVILVVSVSTALICLVLTIYLAINRIKIQKVINFQKVFVLDTTNSLKKDHARKYEKFSYNPPLNPAETGPNDWNSVAQDVGKMVNSYDRIILVLGEETLVYPASALAFMLENLPVPVVVTSPKFINGALEKKTKIPEVMVYDGENLLRATRTISNAKNEFISPNFPPLTHKNGFPKSEEAFKVYLVNPAIKIAVVKVQPNMNDEYLAKILETDIKAVILELWGERDISLNKEIIGALGLLLKKGIMIVSVPQYEKSDKMDPNPTLQKIGVIHLGDMTTSSAYGKLSFLLSNVDDSNMLRELCLRNFRGEMTIEKKVKKKGHKLQKNKAK